MTHKKLESRKPKSEAININKSQLTKKEKRAGRRNIFVLGIFLLLTLSIAGIANWRIFKNSGFNSSPENSSSAAAVGMPPTMPSNNPSKEFVYSGGSLLATVEPFREAPDDFAVWRPADGTWYILNSSNQTTYYQFGMNGDIPAPGDYDGDGKVDFGIYRPSNGTWYIFNSSTSAYSIFVLGGVSGDKPVVADYDGDGRSDAAIFQTSTGYWQILKSSTNSVVWHSFGFGTDIPKPIDFDGDGKADLTVWRDSQALFYIQKSTDNVVIGYQVGQSGDEPIVGDFNGDGRADPGTRRSDGSWRVYLTSTGSFMNLSWGFGSDITVPGDYDKDGKTDIAVWRPSNGVWYVSKSSAGGAMLAVSWGQAGDIPVPAAYRR